MDINIENNSLNLSINNSSVEVVTGNSNTELDIIQENNNLDLETDNPLVEFNIEMQTIYEKNHANLENLDYESSGHTGFQKAGDYALKNEIPNVSGFAKKEEIPTKTSQLANDSGYIDSIPDNYITEEELNKKGYLTEHQDLSAYAKKTDIPDVSNFITKDVSNLTNYYDKDYINEMIGDIETLLGGI